MVSVTLSPSVHVAGVAGACAGVCLGAAADESLGDVASAPVGSVVARDIASEPGNVTIELRLVTLPPSTGSSVAADAALVVTCPLATTAASGAGIAASTEI